MNFYKKKLLLIIFINSLCFNIAWAYTPQSGGITATFGPYFYRTNFAGVKTKAESPFMGGMGLVATGDLNNHGSLEISIFSINKIYLREEAGKYIAEQTKNLLIGMGYRYWFSQKYSSSLSFYSSYPMGDPRKKYSDFSPGTEPPTSARDTTEYGFDLAFQGELWVRNPWAVVFDLRYSYSVTNKVSEHSDHYGLLLGARYQIQ